MNANFDRLEQTLNSTCSDQMKNTRLNLEGNYNA